MKIKFEIELDTKEDGQLSRELLELVQALKQRVEQLNEEDWEDD